MAGKKSKKKEEPKTNKELRDFGMIMALALSIVTGILFYTEKLMPGTITFSIGAFFLLAGLFVPRILVPLEWLWMRFAHLLNAIVTRVILFFTFYGAVLPLGIAMRLTGKDSMGLKLDRDADSYWDPVEVDGPSTRFYTPY